jgi:hypothetical protein
VSDEELNRKMEFIVEQQAQFAADIQILNENVRALQENAKVLQEVATTALQSVSTTSATSMTLIDRYKELADAQAETQRTVDRVARLIYHHASDGHGFRGPEATP